MGTLNNSPSLRRVVLIVARLPELATESVALRLRLRGQSIVAPHFPFDLRQRGGGRVLALASSPIRASWFPFTTRHKVTLYLAIHCHQVLRANAHWLLFVVAAVQVYHLFHLCYQSSSTLHISLSQISSPKTQNASTSTETQKSPRFFLLTPDHFQPSIFIFLNPALNPPLHPHYTCHFPPLLRKPNAPHFPTPPHLPPHKCKSTPKRKFGNPTPQKNPEPKTQNPKPKTAIKVA
jgi:hypothetical protein